MPRLLWCQGCQESHLIRDEFVGSRVCCDCGFTQTVPSEAPSVAASTGLLDKPVVQVGSVGLLFVSALVLGGVIALILGVEAQDSPKTPPVVQSSAKKSTTTKKQAVPPTPNPPHKGAGQGDLNHLALLLKQLESPDLETSKKAVEELADLDGAIARRAIPALVAAARLHNNNEFRKLAADELKRLGPPLDKKDYDCLKVALHIEHPDLPHYVISALKDMGEKARDAMAAVVDALKHRDPQVRSEALVILKSLGGPARAPALRLLLYPRGDVSDEEASLAALETLLRQAPSAEEIDVLADVLSDVKKRLKMRRFAVGKLGQGKPDARAVPALLEVLREQGDTELMTLSLQALSRIGVTRKEVLTELRSVAESAGDERIRLVSLQTIAKLDPSALSSDWIVKRWTAEKSYNVRLQLAKMLKSQLALLSSKQMTRLAPLLKHESTEIVLIGLEVVRNRKAEAADVSGEVANLLTHKDATVRNTARYALAAIGPALEQSLPNFPQRLIRLLDDRDPAIRLLALEIVQDRKDKAANAAGAVVPLLRDKDDAKIREAAVNALQALGSAADRVMPRLVDLLDLLRKEGDDAVQKALDRLLRSRLAMLKREQMKGELSPLLGDDNAAIVRLGLAVVKDHKAEAADVAAEVAELLTHKDATLRAEAQDVLDVLGPIASKAASKLFEVHKQAPEDRRASLLLTAAHIIEANDSTNVDRLLPLLLYYYLHPDARGTVKEAKITLAIVRFEQRAVDRILTALNDNLNDEHPGTTENADYRTKLYAILGKLGPKCQSPGNYEALDSLRKKEAKMGEYNKRVTAAAAKARDAMEDR